MKPLPPQQRELQPEQPEPELTEAPEPAELRRVVIPAEHAGARLDRALAALLPELSRGRVQELLAQGLVRFAGAAFSASVRPETGATLAASARLEAGAQVELRLVPARSKLFPVPMELPVLYQDESLLILDKPASLAVHPGPGERGATVLHGLLALLGPQARPGLAHRLDKGTSGCLAVAKTEPALRGLQAAFQSRQVEKLYLALVHGTPPERGEFDTLHGPHPDDQRRFSTRVAQGPRALTRYRVLARGELCALVEVSLLTGRTHQIRAHFADAGFPLLCDRLYGGTALEARLAVDAPARLAALALGRLALHAHSLAFAHPITGVALSCKAPLPADLRLAQAQLGLTSIAEA